VTYSLTEDAARELEEAFDRYLEHASPKVATDFLAAFERAARLVDRYPGVGTPTKNGRLILPLRRYPYSLIYRSTPEGARIGAVAPQRRGPLYWRGALAR
jgi:plasmid stabilization system protein ParE